MRGFSILPFGRRLNPISAQPPPLHPSPVIRMGLPLLLGMLFWSTALQPAYTEESIESFVPGLLPNKQKISSWDGKTPYIDPDLSDLSLLLEIPDDTINRISAEALFNRAGFIGRNLILTHQKNGIVWKRRFFDPPGFGPGGDSALFTGFYLAAATYRYAVTREGRDLNEILKTLRGLHILCHISGTPGVVARAAYTMDPPHNLWENRRKKKHVYINEANVPDILSDLGTPYPRMWFYTRTTRDQLTGLLYGLAVAWMELPKEAKQVPKNQQSNLIFARDIIKDLVRVIYFRLKETRYVIRDQKGRSGTSSKHVSGYLRLQLLALFRRTLIDQLHQQKKKTGLIDLDEAHLLNKIRKEYDHYFKWVIVQGFVFDKFNFLSHYSQYYAWNLRFARGYSIFLCDTNYSRKAEIFNKVKRSLWAANIPFTKVGIKYHKNTFFTFLYVDLLRRVWRDRKTYYRKLRLSENNKNDNPAYVMPFLEDAVWSLKSLSIRPLRSWPSPLEADPPRGKKVLPVHLRSPTQHFIWQKPPWYLRPDKQFSGRGEATGVDFLLPYWMGMARFNDLAIFQPKIFHNFSRALKDEGE